MSILDNLRVPATVPGMRAVAVALGSGWTHGENTMLRSAIISLLVVTSASTADAAPKPRPIDGAWAASSQACLDPSDSNIRIVGRKYYEHEGSCTIVKEIKSGDRWNLSLKCEGEGETWNKSVSISQKSSNELRILGTGSSFSPLVRCKPQQRPPNWPAR